MAEMETEQIAYLKGGEEVEILERTPHGIIVAHRYEDQSNDGEECFGKPYLVESVFDTPPVERKHESIAALEPLDATPAPNPSPEPAARATGHEGADGGVS